MRLAYKSRGAGSELLQTASINDMGGEVMRAVYMLTAMCVGLFLVAGCVAHTKPSGSADTRAAVKDELIAESVDWGGIAKEAGRAMLDSPLFLEYLDAYKIDTMRAGALSDVSGDVAASAQLVKPDTRPLVSLSDIQNNTSEHIDMEMMTEQLRTVLNDSRVLRFNTRGSKENTTGEESSVKGAEQNSAEQGGAKVDLSLSGKITERAAVGGNGSGMSYSLNMILTDVHSGETVWTYDREFKR